MKLYFTRHGETDNNSKDIILGATDQPLNERGIMQAKELAEKIFKELKIDIIYSSPLKRALATAKYISKRTGSKIIADYRLREWNYGEYEGKGRYYGSFQDDKAEFGMRIGKTGESLLQLAHRVYSCLDDILTDNQYENVLVVSHGGVARVVKSYFTDVSTAEYREMFMKNCDVWEFRL